MGKKDYREDAIYLSDNPSDKLNIPDFCDMEEFERMMKDWADSTGLATVAVGSDGKYISGCYNFTDFCYNLTRKSREGLHRCIECDKKGAGIYLCHAGLVDFAAPITLEDGTVLGNIVGGQVLPQKPDIEKFRKTAHELGIDEEAYLKALQNVNVRSQKEISSSAELLSNIINLFVRTSYAAWVSEERYLKRADIISSLGKVYFCDYYVNLDTEEFVELDATSEIHGVIGHYGSASKSISAVTEVFVAPESSEAFKEFMDISTLKDRLLDRQSLSLEFIGRNLGWCRVTIIVASRDINDDVSHVIFAVQNIQDEKENELKVRQMLKDSADEANRANMAKSDFLSRMSHDIRTPLNGIIGMSYLANQQNNPSKTTECLEKIDFSSKFLLGLINDVLDMAKVESGKIELHTEPYSFDNFRKYLESVIIPLCENDHQKFLIDADDFGEAVPVMDKLRINQIFFNLFSNAVKYTPEGGTISFKLKHSLTDSGRIRLYAEISDNGIGMSEAFQKTLFQPFVQENRNDSSELRGSGLGLAIVKQLLDLMGGTISVESEINKGTTFKLEVEFDYVMAEDIIEEKENLSINDGKIDLTGKHILLCEDHPLNIEITRELLESKGAIVEVAEDGALGIDAFKKSRKGFYDAILMDIRMPVMNGYETTEKIRSIPRSDAKTVPIIAMTADAFEDDVHKCIAAGMNNHIAKPIDPETLLRLIENYTK